MKEERKEITITIKNDHEERVVKTYLNQYRNLMVLINNNIFPEDFGECGGQGRCATCIVSIPNLKGNSCTMERNEEATINKAGLKGSNFRLSCQILVTEDLNGAIIDICEKL